MRGREASSDATANSGTPQYMRRNLSQQTAVASPSDTPVDSIANMDHDPSERVAASDEEKAAEADDVFNVLSQRKTNASGASAEDHAQIEALLGRMFGQSHHLESGEQNTRHVGVVFKNLTVRGVGLGAMLQSTLSDPFLALPRLLKNLFTKSRSSTRRPPIRKILDNFTGIIKPGEMLLVLGAPGAGCSTFLKVLANQRYGYESVDGDVSYGETDAKIMRKLYRNEVVYNPEDDIHYVPLSVRDTLSFALNARTYGKASRSEGQSRGDYIKDFLNLTTRLFWIEHTLSTRVGDENIRGVSGREKKRVSIAEAIIPRATTQCWDNSTRGLDSSTALEYVQALRPMTNLANISTSVALYQAGESLYNLFDKVLLIHEGRCVYFGPAEQAAAYFEGLGFTRPARWTTADFLTSVTDSHEQKVKEGWEDRVPRSTEQLADAYAKSQINQANLRDVAEFEKRMKQERQEHLVVSTKNIKPKNYTLPFHQQVTAVARRQFLVLWGDKPTLFGKWGGILFQSLIFGSLFYILPKTSEGVFPRGSVLFLLLLFNAVLAMAELNSTFDGRAILQKHKSFSFFRPSAFAIAQVVADVPQAFIQVLIFSLVTYFMAGLARTASQFFIALLFLWISTMTMYSFFRAIGSLSKSLDIATRITGLALQAIVVYTGYFIPPIKMRPWLKWLRYINPIAYSFEALLSNEFHNLQIECVGPNVVPRGPNTSSRYQSCTIQGSQPGQLSVRGDDYITTGFEYTRAHLWRNLGILVAFWMFFAMLTALEMETQKPAASGGATTIFKRGQAPMSVERAMANGSTPLDEEKAIAANEDKLQEESNNSDTEATAESIAKNESVFTFTNVNYTIPVNGGERQLLNNIQGFVRPGKLTALMGASGAGKTTLLRQLAQRQSVNFGIITGDFQVDGRPLPKYFQRATGFAEQSDIHEPTTTVREALRFSALLRQPKEVPVETKYEYCERILDLLEMRSIAGATIGRIGEGLNQEQRKRLTIGVELASKPELLMFLDEPTPGLDSAAAFNIVRFLRKLADAGQAILCTIHQPSSVLFDEFDELLLLKSGGRVVYHGPLGKDKDSRLLIDYFEKNGAKKCPPNANPAEYMLEAIGAGSLGIQINMVVRGNFTAYYRDPNYMAGKFILHILTGLFNTFTFYHAGNEIIDMQSRLFSVFLTVAAAPPLMQQLQPKFVNYRQIYLSREAGSKIYSWVAYTIAAVLVEIPYSILAGTIYYACWWWAALGQSWTASENGYAWLLLMLFELFYVSFAQAIAAVAPNENLASVLIPVFYIFCIAFCGVLVPFAALPHFWQSWMYYLTPFRY